MRLNIVLLFFFFTFQSIAQDIDFSVYPYWKYYGNVSNALYETISEQGFEQLASRKDKVRDLETLYDWRTYQRSVRAKLDNIFGPFPEKTPLNPVVTGTLERDDFTVEKLYFESMPEYYVTSALFLPKGRSGKVPAIIYCSGHTENGFRSETYQHIIMNYVKKGFAVLAIDPIGQGERIQYVENGKPRFGATHEHSYPGSQAILAGITPGKYFIWDGIRAVDYLLSRPEIDGERIGITGRSGGGTQSAYIAAMDERILAAAPECYITSFDKLYRSIGPQDAEQNWIGGLAEELDMADLIEVRAPKPTMIVSTTRDFFNIQGAKDSYLESKRVFEAYGKPDQLKMAVDDEGHASTESNREAAYAFFQKYLSNPGNSRDEETELFSEEELWVTKTGNVFNEPGGKNMHSIMQWEYLSRKNPSDHSKSIVEGLQSKFEFEGSVKSVFSGRFDADDYTVNKYLVGAVGKYPVPLIWYRPKLTTENKVIVIFREKGKKEYEDSGLPEQLVSKGYHVLIPDLSGTGELGGGFEGGDARIGDVPLNIWYGGAVTGLLPVEIRSREINMIVKYVKNQLGEVWLSGVAEGFLVSDLLHASLGNKEFDKIVIDGSCPTWASLIVNKEYNPKFLLSSVPGAIYNYDLPDLIEYHPCQEITLISDASSDELSGKRIDSENYTRKGVEKVKSRSPFGEGLPELF